MAPGEHLLRTPRPPEDEKADQLERQRYAAMLREQALLAKEAEDTAWAKDLDPALDFELRTPRPPTAAERAAFGAEYAYESVGRDGIAATWMNQRIATSGGGGGGGGWDPDQTRRAMAPPKRPSFLGGVEIEEELPPPPPPPPPLEPGEDARRGEQKADPQWRPPSSNWPKEEDEEEEEKEGEEDEDAPIGGADAGAEAVAAEAAADSGAASESFADDDFDPRSSMDVPEEDDFLDDDDEWNDAGPGYSSKRPWDDEGEDDAHLPPKLG